MVNAPDYLSSGLHSLSAHKRVLNFFEFSFPFFSLFFWSKKTTKLTRKNWRRHSLPPPPTPVQNENWRSRGWNETFARVVSSRGTHAARSGSTHPYRLLSSSFVWDKFDAILRHKWLRRFTFRALVHHFTVCQEIEVPSLPPPPNSFKRGMWVVGGPRRSALWYPETDTRHGHGAGNFGGFAPVLLAGPVHRAVTGV